mmetsp:Transcript_17299/g.43476  ORF Transcript_17299/g.43476 Transcript_17299/m.43476 type:complete len:100 (+) Transcript_17299:327-626(+)
MQLSVYEDGGGVEGTYQKCDGERIAVHPGVRVHVGALRASDACGRLHTSLAALDPAGDTLHGCPTSLQYCAKGVSWMPLASETGNGELGVCLAHNHRIS